MDMAILTKNQTISTLTCGVACKKFVPVWVLLPAFALNCRKGYTARRHHQLVWMKASPPVKEKLAQGGQSQDLFGFYRCTNLVPGREAIADRWSKRQHLIACSRDDKVEPYSNYLFLPVPIY
eukprot:95843-Amphidinium_carterae.1